SLFGESEENSFTLDESIYQDIPQVSSQENSLFTAEFSESEAIFSMKHNKAPSPDGFPAEFYQQFWETIKGDLLQMFRDLSKGDLPLFSLNFGVITLIPKVLEANIIQQYRPICLLNVSYKIFTKVATNRLGSVADKVVSLTQTAFIKGRNILEGVRSNPKVDFEKACDKVRWPFLFQTLRMKGFSSKWISWIETFISGSSVAVNVNDDVEHYFQTKKKASDKEIHFHHFCSILRRAKLDGQFEGVIPHLVDGGLSILQYADDTILFMDHDLNKTRNMKLLLFAFEQASGLMINFHKSELFCFEVAQEKVELYTELFGCKAGNFPINYLELKSDLKRDSVARNRSISQSKGDENKKKYGLAKWSILCQPKDQGGLGILDLNTKNSALLSKWLYKLLISDGTWQQLLCNKYIGSKPLAQVEWKIGDSHLMKVKLDFLRFGTFRVMHGSQVIFLEDIWLDGAPLKDQYPSIYNIARPKSVTIAEAMSSSPPILSWRRQLYRTNLEGLELSLVSRLEGLELSQEQDAFYWNLTPNGKFLGIILTKYNLAKRNWQESLTCAFCHKEGTINHLFFECRLARSIWSVSQMATSFNPLQNIILSAAHWLSSWVILQQEEVQPLVAAGSRHL
ncbi:LOW QUALITY PROTEIN: hypothetical protein U9M48_027365, partial [Paspalum notatum var. saurae]